MYIQFIKNKLLCLTTSKPRNSGFTAVTAVVLLSMGSLAYTLAVSSASLNYADGVYRRELRIQAGLNVQSCLDGLLIMAAKDYYMKGKIEIPSLGCSAIVANDLQGHYLFNLSAELRGVAAYLAWSQR